MKRFSLYITLLCIAFSANMSISFATTSTLSPTAPIVGTATGENAGALTFNYETWVPGANEVSINANPSSLVFAGTFWTENAGWCTFNGLGTSTAFLTGSTNDMPMKGFAWCENAGWISFNPTGITDFTSNASNSRPSDVFFNKPTGTFHGFAWSENLGWINMDGLMTDITAPDITANFKPFAASGSKVFTLSDPSPVASGINLYKFEVDDWNNDATWYISEYNTPDPKFTHDFRKAKDTYYRLRITDPFGNSSEGTVKVVANVPADSITLPIDGFMAGGVASVYTGSFIESRVADADQTHSVNIKLRDQYGNSVKTEPGIKDVTVTIGFDNNVDKNQIDSLVIWGQDDNGGDAIIYGGNLKPTTPTYGASMDFGGIWTYQTGSITNSADGIYTTLISSYAPTRIGYTFTTLNNNIQLKKVSYKITPFNSYIWVGEVLSETDKMGSFTGNNPLKFSPALYIGSVSNNDNWAIRTGYDTEFRAALLTGTTVALDIPKVAHILNIKSHVADTLANTFISYQNPSVTSGGTKVCEGYNRTVATFSPGEYTIIPLWSTECNRTDLSSNLLMENPSSPMVFSWQPKIILASPQTNVVSYTSEISYTNGTTPVKYPSYSRNNSSALDEFGTNNSITSTTGSWVINQSVKILGMTNARSTIDVLEGNNTNKVGSLTRTDIKNAIHKNVETMTRGGVPPSARYVVYTGATISNTTWPANKDTLIIKWGDLTITDDITGGTAIRGIIVLEDDAGDRGNIYVGKDVGKIAAVLYADKSIISWDGSTFYSDNKSATGQLFLEGSIISDNTIGWASMTPLKCPYNVNCSTDNEANDAKMAKRYDLNYFRFYTGTGDTSLWTPTAGLGYPFVIQYDTRLQTAPPPGFSME